MKKSLRRRQFLPFAAGNRRTGGCGIQPAFKSGVNERVDVSFVILTHNRIERCVENVRRNVAALRGARAEILVVNNGQGPLPLGEAVDGVRCRQFKMAHNLGASARNIGVREAAGDIVLMLDDDAYVTEGAVEAMLAIFRTDPRVGAVGFRIRGKDGEEEACLLPCVFHGCACGFRKAVLVATGGYPSTFLYYGEEYDLAFRLHAAGHRIVLGPDGCWACHVRDGGGRDMDRIVSRLVRNNLMLWFTFFPWRHVPAAVRDTLRRYALVARKENALKGFRRGVAAAPWALWRAVARRRCLDAATFGKVTLLDVVGKTCRQLKELGTKETIVCGVGKFPTMWARAIRAQGLDVRGFCDRSSLWKGHSVGGVRVRVTERAEPGETRTGLAWLVGTSSRVENEYWTAELAARGLPYAAIEEGSGAGA